MDEKLPATEQFKNAVESGECAAWREKEQNEWFFNLFSKNPELVRGIKNIENLTREELAMICRAAMEEIESTGNNPFWLELIAYQNEEAQKRASEIMRLKYEGDWVEYQEYIHNNPICALTAGYIEDAELTRRNAHAARFPRPRKETPEKAIFNTLYDSKRAMYASARSFVSYACRQIDKECPREDGEVIPTSTVRDWTRNRDRAL